MRPAILVIALLATLPFAASAGDPIQPGDVLNDDCTLNFVFDGIVARAGALYIGTAANCVDVVGESASTTSHPNFGEVVYRGDPDTFDFALIQIHEHSIGWVLPGVLGFPLFPSGSTASGLTDPGDPLVISGWGVGFAAAKPTRETRVGILIGDTPSEYVADTMAVNGDSGGPLVRADGLALGTISVFSLAGTPPATDHGPTLEGILAELAAAGFPVVLRTAS